MWSRKTVRGTRETALPQAVRLFNRPRVMAALKRQGLHAVADLADELRIGMLVVEGYYDPLGARDRSKHTIVIFALVPAQQ